jgi:IclR family mhp operon transcriptional activator
MGRAYLAFCSASTRRQTLDLIAAKYESGEVPIMSLATFRQILLKTQQDGYGSNYGEWVEDKKVAAIAVPVRATKGAVVGCLNVVAITRAVNPQQLASRFLAPLTEAARSIERLLID